MTVYTAQITAHPLLYNMIYKLVLIALFLFTVAAAEKDAADGDQAVSVAGNSTNSTSVPVGATGCVEGYVMDLFCIERSVRVI